MCSTEGSTGACSLVLAGEKTGICGEEATEAAAGAADFLAALPPPAAAAAAGAGADSSASPPFFAAFLAAFLNAGPRPSFSSASAARRAFSASCGRAREGFQRRGARARV